MPIRQARSGISDNGKVERSHLTDELEFYQLLDYTDDVDLRAKRAVWEEFYNVHRPHAAFGRRTPTRFSVRRWRREQRQAKSGDAQPHVVRRGTMGHGAEGAASAVPGLGRVAASRATEFPIGFNLIGHLTSRTGLGAGARMTLSLIHSRGWDLAITDIETRGIDARVPLPVNGLPVVALGGGPASVNLLHMNPWQLMYAMFLMDADMVSRLGLRFLACVPYWELEEFPQHWIEVLRAMDVVLAPTKFIAEAVERAVCDQPDRPDVIYFMQSTPVREGVIADRSRWFAGREDRVVYLSSFDFSSDAARKNPMAVLEAFEQAFRGRDDVALAFKTGHAMQPEAIAARNELSRRAAEDGRVVLIEEQLTDAEMSSLLASADVYVSLHRSEGLGLGMMESMALGVPVIATGWSGNMDFMDDQNSIPVAFSMVPIDGSYHPEYRNMKKRLRWAEPDIESAVRAMRDLADDASRRAALADAARAAMKARWIEYEKATALGDVLRLAGSGDWVEPHRRRVRRLGVAVRRRSQSPSRLILEFKKFVVARLRRAGLKPPPPPGERPAGPWCEIDPYSL